MILSWDDSLLESWDAYAFSPVCRETQANRRMVTVGDTDFEALPSNQEAYSQESPEVIGNQPLFDLIQAGFKTIEGRINTVERRFDIIKESLDVFEKKQADYKESVTATLQQHSICIKQMIATQRLHSVASQ